MAKHVATLQEITAFLRRFVGAMDQYGLDLWPNTKNKAFEDEAGFTKADAELLVRMLRPIDYSKGPEPDSDSTRPAGEVWVFGREFEGTEMYVKLKLETPSVSVIPSVCLSFHPEERPLGRPHWPRRGGGSNNGYK